METEEIYFVAKRRKHYPTMFWKKSNMGYTADLKDAREFTMDEALEITSRPFSDKIMLTYAEAVEQCGIME